MVTTFFVNAHSAILEGIKNGSEEGKRLHYRVLKKTVKLQGPLLPMANSGKFSYI
jgi:hypothetical protein